MKQQRICGVILVLLSILIVILAAHSTTMEERDITVVLLLLPLGVYLICTKSRVTYAAQRQKKTANEAATSIGGMDKLNAPIVYPRNR